MRYGPKWLPGSKGESASSTAAASSPNRAVQQHRRLVMREQRFDLAAQRVVAASGLGEE